MNEAYSGDGSLEEQVGRGAERTKNALLELAAQRPLTKDEINELKILFGVNPPTREFAEKIRREGMEE